MNTNILCENNFLRNTQFILASGSPRRIEMMHNNEIYPLILPPNVDESLPEGLSMEQSVMYLALKKGLASEEVFLKILSENHDAHEPSPIGEHPIIIAADTIVYHNGIIGKPKNKKDAFKILSALNGQTHYVATGVALMKAGTNTRHLFCEITKVFFKEYNKKNIVEYINTPEPYDKAGGYAIQGAWGKYVDHIEGNRNNVVGFPWERIISELKTMLEASQIQKRA